MAKGKQTLSEIDNTEDLVIDSEVNISNLRDKNSLIEILSRNNNKRVSLLDNSVVYTEKPEFCRHKCKNCKALVKYSISEIKYNSKIGIFLN